LRASVSSTDAPKSRVRYIAVSEMKWDDLEPQGKLFVPYCDSHGMVFDSKRDRMIFSGVGGAYNKKSDGTLLAFDFSTKALSLLAPENADLGKTG